MINNKINNKMVMTTYYRQSYKSLNNNQIALLVHQHSYCANQYYIENIGYIA